MGLTGLALTQARKEDPSGRYTVKSINKQVRNGRIVRYEQSDDAVYTRIQTGTDPMQDR